MSTRKQTLLAAAQAASQEYALAKRQLTEAQFCQRHGMASDIPSAASFEHTAYHRWHRALSAFHACI